MTLGSDLILFAACAKKRSRVLTTALIIFWLMIFLGPFNVNAKSIYLSCNFSSQGSAKISACWVWCRREYREKAILLSRRCFLFQWTQLAHCSRVYTLDNYMDTCMKFIFNWHCISGPYLRWLMLLPGCHRTRGILVPLQIFQKQLSIMAPRKCALGDETWKDNFSCRAR